MIRFRYKMPEALEQLARQTIIDFNDSYFYGMMEEGDVPNLAHCALYLVCQTQYITGTTIYKNPIVVVARNEIAALTMYATETHIGDASVHSVLETRCDKIKVEAVEE